MRGIWGSVRCVGALSLIAVLCGTTPVLGTTVFPLGGGWEAHVPDGSTVSIVVDIVDPDFIAIEVAKDYLDPPGPGGVFPAQLVDFIQVGDDASTVDRIVILDEVVTNQTGVHWTDYHWNVLDGGSVWFDVGLSSGFSVAPFTNKTFTDLHGFGDPNKATDLDADGGLVYSNSSFFPGGAPGNGELVIDVDLSGDVAVSFLFKQFPTPEPTSLMLLLAGVFVVRPRRR